jgi:hypothetical protein
MLLLAKLLPISIILVVFHFIEQSRNSIIPTSLLILCAKQIEVLELRRKQAIRGNGGIQSAKFGNLINIDESGNRGGEVSIDFIDCCFLLL